MSPFDRAFQRAGGRYLRDLPAGWAEAIQARGREPGLVALAEGLASFAVPEGARKPPEATILVALLVLLAQAEGHAGLVLEGPGRELTEELAGAFHTSLAAVAEQLGRMRAIVGGPDQRMPLILDRGTLYSERLFRAETRLGAVLGARCAPGTQPDLSALDPAVLEDPQELNPEQRLGVARALDWPLTVITGGPGTGKTSIVVAILRSALRRNVPLARIALAAPTGKAANRMDESILKTLLRLDPLPAIDAPLLNSPLKARTLHRLLGYHPTGDSYRHHQENPIAADLVIIDESSMVDLVLMERLLRAVPPKARLVLLGDGDQLPSVEAGRVFADLVAALGERVTVLTRSYRMRDEDPAGCAVLTAARWIVGQETGKREGLFGPPYPILAHDPAQPPAGVDLLDVPQKELEAFLLRWLAKEIEAPLPDYGDRLLHVHRMQDGAWAEGEEERLKVLLDSLNRVKILCPLRQASEIRGAQDINDFLHAKVSDVRDRKLSHRLSVSLGEPVMMTRNDYRRGLFNGDQGIVLMVARDGGRARLEAVFPCEGGGFAGHAIGPLLHDLELAYALTVHKAQGSEYERVAVVLPRVDSGFVTREILYTALTRAQKSVTLVAGREAVEKAAGRALTRHSGLVARMAEHGGQAGAD